MVVWCNRADCDKWCGKPDCLGPPQYKIPAGAKYRRIPARELTGEEWLAYSEAIVSTVRRAQDAWWRSERAVVPPQCASGSFANGGEEGDVGDVIRAKQRAALHRPQFIRSNGTVANGSRQYSDWIRDYIAAMMLKHGKDWTYDNED